MLAHAFVCQYFINLRSAFKQKQRYTGPKSKVLKPVIRLAVSKV